MATTLGDALRTSGVIGGSVFKKAEDEARRTGNSLLATLAALPGVDGDLLGMVVARHYGLPYSHVSEKRIATGLVADLNLRKLRQLNVLPMDLKGRNVTLAAADPGVKDEVEALLAPKGMKAEWVVVPLRELEAEFGRLILNQIEAPSAPPSRTGRAAGARSGPVAAPSRPASVSMTGRSGRDESVRSLDEAVATGDAIAVLDAVLSLAVDAGASDVHIVYDAATLSVRIRRDGVLHAFSPACAQPVAAAVISRIKVIAELDITEVRLPQDGRARVQLTHRSPPVSVLMRVSTVPSRQGEKVTLRILEKGSRLLDLKEISLSRDNHKMLVDALAFPNGVVLVTGPTGSGKTTTVYAALKHLISDSISVFTLEDPIEYELAGTYQCQVHEAIKLSFPVMLRSMLRQDPNVMLVGEMRDADTARIAFEAGLTGHFVISTLHANSATTAVTRLLEMGVEPFVMGTCTRAIVAQRLVRKLCRCKRPVYRMAEELVRTKETLGLIGSSVHEPAGCPDCAFTGYSGRVAIHEVLTLDRGLADLVLGRANAGEILAAARVKGFRPMIMDGFSKVLAGQTTAGEVVRQVGPPILE